MSPRLIGLITILTCAVALAGCSSEAKQIESVTDSGEQLLVSASTVGMFAQGSSWSLIASSAKGATLTVDGEETHIALDQSQLAKLRNVAETERFFELDSHYGEYVADGSTKTLTIAYGGKSHTVEIHFLMNWVHNNPEKLTEPARAVRVMGVVRDWIDHPDAVDLRRFDQMVLDAVQQPK